MHIEAFEAISGSSEPLKSFIYEPLLSTMIALLSTFKVVTLRAFDHILASSIGGTLTALSGKSFFERTARIFESIIEKSITLDCDNNDTNNAAVSYFTATLVIKRMEIHNLPFRR